MAQITVSGAVCGGSKGGPAVVLKEITPTYKVAELSIRDTEYFYNKGEDRPGQFYKIQITGKQAEIAVERLDKGDFIMATGQLVQREYNDRIYLDVKDARFNQPYKNDSNVNSDPF